MSTAPAPSPAPPPRSFGPGFWLLNVVEAGERLAFYTLWPVAGIFIMQATEPGGLKLTAAHRGTIFLWFSLSQAVLPIVTGGFADRYGFKKTLLFSMLVNLAAYLTMVLQHNYAGFFTGMLLLGIGSACFKPAIQGGLAHALSRQSSSVGWGIFYWVVNVGAFCGHLLSPIILTAHHSEAAYRNLFLSCAGFCVVNMLLLLAYRDVPTGASTTANPLQVLGATVRNIFEPRLLTWLLIMSCFWMMMYQLWDSMPNFIEDWVDSSRLAELSPIENWRQVGPDGRLRIPQQVLLSLNAFLIVLLVVPVSHLVRRMRSLSAMLGGMFVVTLGMFIAGSTQAAGLLLAGVFCFSIGEMLTGPKKSEYLALIAPHGKKALYLGYVVIPTGIGRGAGNWLAGQLYGRVGEKAVLAQRYLMEHTPLGEGRDWDGSVHSLEAALGVSRHHAFARLQETLGMNGPEATRLLWETYHPQLWFWLPFVAVGVVATIALYLYGRMAKKWADMNA